MKKGIMVSTKVTIIVLIIILVNTISIGVFGYIVYRNDSIKGSFDKALAIAKSASMSITPNEFRHALNTKEKNEHYEHLKKQFERIKVEENLLYFYGGTFDPDKGMIMYIEGHGDIFGLNGNVPLSIFPQAAFDAFKSGTACVSNVYRLNIDGSWGISAYAPIFDENQKPIGLIGVLMSIQDVFLRSYNLTLTLFVISLAIFLVIIWIPIFYIRRSVAKPLLALQTASNKIAQGDMDINIPMWKTNDEVGMLSHNFSTMKEIVIGMHQEVKDLVNNATSGNLDYRAHSEKYPGAWREVITKFNDLMDTIMLPIDEAANTLHKIASGDFSARILSEYMGDFDLIKKAVNSTAIDLDRYLTEKEKAEKALYKAEQKANRAKSEFLSRMSHEMRTPMNAIIGMTKIAETTEDLSRLKYCLNMIGISARHLLGIINDVLDMSKIEAGKLELENVPMNIEKMLMKVCNIVIDNMEKKNQKFNVVLSKDLNLNYIADDLRLSQVITNLLSNAVKFTPEGGKITLSIEEIKRHENTNTVKFSVADTGIGMTSGQIARLFNAFEQADGSISRKFGGTGLGLIISKSIVEKMGGRIHVESKPKAGSTFSFEVNLERTSHQNTIIFDGIRPEDIRLLVVENDNDTRKHFLNITDSFGIKADSASNKTEALALLDVNEKKGRTYDIVFIDHDLPETNGIDFANELSNRIEKNAIIIITTYLELHRIKNFATDSHLTHFITKPLFPSSILDTINEIVGTTLKGLEIKTDKTAEVPDLSDVHIILAEDVEINQEIFTTLLEETKISIDIAENGLIAVSKFKENPDKYDLIIMDIQMPEMDGYQATMAIREMDLPKAKTIPIIAMTANVFKEDIDRCLESGMNDHLAKPIDEIAVINKIAHYSKQFK
ncbi:MAG: response regulator [Spirochaetaceae bacterium]|nr:response regulator [Spirochaetaceae bacterium]